MLTCREFVDFLLAYQAGELPARPRAVLGEHLAGCAACTAYLHSYRQTVRIEKLACGCGDPPPPASTAE